VVSAQPSADTDLVIIGGGPAGLAAALSARRCGFDVVVVDRDRPPIDKACGEGLMPDGVAALAEIGVKVDRTLGFPFRGIRFLGEGAVAEAAFAQGCGIGIRRTALHRVLIEHSTAAGIACRWGAQVDALEAAGIWVDGQMLRCRWVVAADGPRRTSLADYLRTWLDGASGLAPKTLERYRQLVEAQIIPHLGRLALQYLRPAQIHDWHTPC
jgi:2-polyprenyl-6-methoxyphenol hydroxylase-like FAD-dependent oxidoreductase